jgi:branched-chain amino acid transport system ATP-binding protein
MSEALLSVQNLSVGYGHVEAVKQLSLVVHKGETVALLGPNGAGKSTLLRAISGQNRSSQGTIVFKGRDITGLRTDKITRAGVLHVPEGRKVLGPLTVQENLELAALASRRCRARELAEGLESIYDMFPILAEFRNVAGGLLSGGQQQMLAMGRALIAKPDVLLLDEPSMGLAPVMVESIYEFLGNRERYLGDIGVILAEQSRIALTVSASAAVLSRGQIVFEGPASEVSHDITVQAYLGLQPDTASP